jgi:hypothetical protein
MAAFDVTTKPTSLTLKPGSTGSIMVVVSNRLGRPIMGLVEGVMTPASAANWLLSPPELQRRYEADPAATVNYEFKVVVPKDAPAQAAQFKARVRDVLAPDDTRVEGQTVGINVSPDQVEPKPKRTGIPWWVFAIAGVVVLGVGFGIYMLVKPKGVPDVVGKPESAAVAALTKAGFDTVVVVDTLGEQDKDTNRVIRQDPKAKDKMPKAGKNDTLKATIVLNRQWAEVPAIVGQREAAGIDRIRSAGFVLGDARTVWTHTESQDNLISRVSPDAGTKLIIGKPVSYAVYQYTTRPISECERNPLLCRKERIGDVRVSPGPPPAVVAPAPH